MSKKEGSEKRLNSSRIRSITNVGGKEKSSRLIEDPKLSDPNVMEGLCPTGVTENIVSDNSSKT